MGRVWCGSQFAGVSVFNGKEWADYNRLSGPLGERIYAIKCCALTGDVWVATNCGLSRYSEKLQAWKHVTRLDGLPPGGIGSMAFDSAGTLYAGTLSDGVVIATLADDYKTFQNVRGPDAESMVPNGTGLPANLIECMLVTHDDVIYAGTQLGLLEGTVERVINEHRVIHRNLERADVLRSEKRDATCLVFGLHRADVTHCYLVA